MGGDQSKLVPNLVYLRPAELVGPPMPDHEPCRTIFLRLCDDSNRAYEMHLQQFEYFYSQVREFCLELSAALTRAPADDEATPPGAEGAVP